MPHRNSIKDPSRPPPPPSRVSAPTPKAAASLRCSRPVGNQSASSLPSLSSRAPRSTARCRLGLSRRSCLVATRWQARQPPSRPDQDLRRHLAAGRNPRAWHRCKALLLCRCPFLRTKTTKAWSSIRFSAKQPSPLRRSSRRCMRSITPIGTLAMFTSSTRDRSRTLLKPPTLHLCPDRRRCRQNSTISARTIRVIALVECLPGLATTLMYCGGSEPVDRPPHSTSSPALRRRRMRLASSIMARSEVVKLCTGHRRGSHTLPIYPTAPAW